MHIDQWRKSYSPTITHDGKHAILFKAVDQNLVSSKSLQYKGSENTKFTGSYAIGSRPVAPDWSPADMCGQGLHFSTTPQKAASHAGSNPRFLAVEVRIDDIVGLSGWKCKAQSARVLKEVFWVSGHSDPEPHRSGYTNKASHWYPKVGDKFKSTRSDTVIEITEAGTGGHWSSVRAIRHDGKSTSMMRKSLEKNYRGLDRDEAASHAAFDKAHAEWKARQDAKGVTTWQEQVEQLR